MVKRPCKHASLASWPPSPPWRSSLLAHRPSWPLPIIPAYRPSTPSCPQDHQRPGHGVRPDTPGHLHDGQPPERAGAPDREVLHQVTITRPYYLQTTEVTLKQWQEVMGARCWPPSAPAGPTTRWCRSPGSRPSSSSPSSTKGARPSTACPLRPSGNTPPGPAAPALSLGRGIDCNRAMYANNSLKAHDCQKYYLSGGSRPTVPPR